MIPVLKQIDFFKWQLNTLSKEWETYYSSRIDVLLDKKECALGILHGIDDKRGNIIIRFSKNASVRINNYYSLYLFERNTLIKECDTFKQFVQSREVIGSGDHGVLSVYVLNSYREYVDIAFTSIPLPIFEKLKKYKEENRNVSILLGKSEPPYRYLKRMQKFIEDNVSTNFLTLTTGKTTTRELFISDKVQTIIRELSDHNEIVIQGPPGTGKSTLVAEVLEQIAQGKKVCITALTNKALMEIAKKLAGSSVEKLVFKTNLSANEKRELEFLNIFKKEELPDSFILLTTYYKLSENILDLKKQNSIFDLLVIEEASQAFYVTLQAFSLLANQLIVIGDPNQLKPIVLDASKRGQIHSNIDLLINGLETWLKRSGSSFYMLQDTYRLNTFNTHLTNSFYENMLNSSGQEAPQVVLKEKFSHLFNKSRTTSLWKLDKFVEQEHLNLFIPELRSLVESLIESNKFEIAILCPYKQDVITVQLALGNIANDLKHSITIETIDRVQGLTVDIVIILLRIGNSHQFVFDKNRFNVATSRARHYNVIITDKSFQILTATSSVEVKTYFDKLLKS